MMIANVNLTPPSSPRLTLARARFVDVLHIFDIFCRFGIKARLASCKPMQCQNGPPNVKVPSNCNVESNRELANLLLHSCCSFTSGNNPIAPFTKSSGCLIRASTLTPGPLRPLQPPCTTSAHDNLRALGRRGSSPDTSALSVGPQRRRHLPRLPALPPALLMCHFS